MTENKHRVFVVATGMSLRDNLRDLVRSYSVDSNSPLGTFIESSLMCMGRSPREPGPTVQVADALKLAPTADRPTTRPAPATSPISEPEHSDVASGSSALQAIVAHLAQATGRPSTRGLSAELASLFADGPPHPGGGDHVVLLVSDSEVGLRCASVLGSILHRHLGGSLRRSDIGNVSGLATGLPCSDVADYIDSESLAGALTEPGVTVAVIGGLAADDRYGMERSGWGIARVLGSAYAAAVASGRRLVLHPIGGHKAMIPVFTALASHLPTGHDVHIEMWSSHRRTPEGLHQPLLRIGVPDEEYWDLQDLSRLPAVGDDPGVRPIRLRSTRWNNYAWQDIDGQYRLTELGRSILELRAACTREPGAPKSR